MRRLKEFIVDNRKYVFDGELVQIFEEDEYNLLKSKPKEINSHRTNYLKTICLVLNNSCNLGCNYCFANKGRYNKPNEQMSFETACKTIDHLVDEVSKNNGKEFSISFFGGEPLLSFELIKKIVSYIENNYKTYKVHYMITTNGTLINSQIAKFMEEHSLDIMISIDGKKEQHDYYRKYLDGRGSYLRIIKNVQNFHNKEILNARITITDINPDICEYIDEILNIGFKRITFAVDYHISDFAFNIFINSLEKLLAKYYSDIKNGKFYDITNFSRVIINIALGQRNLSHCNAGISYLAVSADGKYYRCPRFVGNDNFLLGCINDETEVYKSLKSFKEKLSLPTLRNSQCDLCTYVYLCGGMCYHHSFSQNNDEFSTTPRECIERITIFEGIIKMICKLSTKERRMLLLFYTNLWNLIRKGEQK